VRRNLAANQLRRLLRFPAVLASTCCAAFCAPKRGRGIPHRPALPTENTFSTSSP
jgi:hypothetical protein